MAIVTISREMGSLGEAIGQSLGRKLNYEYLNRQTMLEKFLGSHINKYELQKLIDSPKAFFQTFTDPQTGQEISYLNYLKEKLPEYAAKNPGVWLGFAAEHFLKGEADVTNIRIIGSEKNRVRRLSAEQKLPDDLALSMLRSQDRREYRFTMTLFGESNIDCLQYDLVINTDKISLLAASNAIVASWKDLFARKQIDSETDSQKISLNPSEIPRLKNPAEIGVARLLDRYGVEWRYEPKTFPVEWDDDGHVTMAFSPDFYLTEFNTYLELTTMDQRYVTTKNKKAKRAKELYDVNVKIVYRKDFEDMIARDDFSTETIEEV